MKKHTRRPRAEYEALLTRKRVEHLTYRELSAESGVPACTLQYWARKLGEAKHNGDDEHQPAAFLQLDVGSDPSPAIEIVLGHDVRVAVRPGFDEATLRAVVEALAC